MNQKHSLIDNWYNTKVIVIWASCPKSPFSNHSKLMLCPLYNLHCNTQWLCQHVTYAHDNCEGLFHYLQFSIYFFFTFCTWHKTWCLFKLHIVGQILLSLQKPQSFWCYFTKQILNRFVSTQEGLHSFISQVVMFFYSVRRAEDSFWYQILIFWQMHWLCTCPNKCTRFSANCNSTDDRKPGSADRAKGARLCFTDTWCEYWQDLSPHFSVLLTSLHPDSQTISSPDTDSSVLHALLIIYCHWGW